jgi:hypothetical protein
MITLLIALASLTGQAQAAPPISSGATVLTGIGATFDNNPATLVVQIQGEAPLVADPDLGLGLVLPVELTMSGRDSFGVSATNSMVTFIPSVRVRGLNDQPVRIYGDAGLGIAEITADREGWLYDSTTHRTGWATRTVLGLEIGPADGGVAVVVEPIGFDTLNFDSRHAQAFISRLGVGVRY